MTGSTRPRRAVLAALLSSAVAVTCAPLVSAGTGGAWSAPRIGGYTVELGTDTDVRTVVEIAGARSCDPDDVVPSGVVTEVMQYGGTKFAGFLAHASCAVRADEGTVELEIVTSERGSLALPDSQAGDRVRVSITERGASTVVVVANLSEEWVVRERVPAVGATELTIGDVLAGAAGMSQELVDFGRHAFGATKVGGRALGESAAVASTVTDFMGTRAVPTALRANGGFGIRQVG